MNDSKTRERVYTLKLRIEELLAVASDGMNRNEVMQSLAQATENFTYHMRRRKWRQHLGRNGIPIIPWEEFNKQRISLITTRRNLRNRTKEMKGQIQ